MRRRSSVAKPKRGSAKAVAASSAVLEELPPEPTPEPARAATPVEVRAPTPAELQGEWKLRTHDSRRWGQCLRGVAGEDSTAVRRLVRTLRDERAKSEVALRRTAVEALVPASAAGNRGALGVQLEALADPEDSVRRSALEGLRRATGEARPPEGGPVALALAETLPNFRRDATTPLRRYRAEAVLQLSPKKGGHLELAATEWLADKDGLVRSAAARALGVLDLGEGSPGRAAMSRCLEDRDWRVTREAVKTLEEVAARQRPAPDADADSIKRSRSSGNLKMGVDEMKRQTSGGSTKSNSCKAIGSKSAPRQPALAALATSCGEGGPLEGLPREAAVAALGRLQMSCGGRAVEAAGHGLTAFALEARKTAINSVASLAKGDPLAAFRASTSRLADADWRIRQSAGEALAASLETGLENADEGHSAEKGLLLSKSAKAAASVLDSTDWQGRRGVAAALRMIGDGSDPQARMVALGSLLSWLKHRDWSVRRKAVQATAAIAEACGGHVRAVKMLRTCYRDPDEEVRVTVATVLPKAAPRKSRAAIEIADKLAQHDEELEIRLLGIADIETLSSDGRSRSRLAPLALLRLMEDPNDQIVDAATKALIAIGRGRRCCVNVMCDKLVHEDAKVRDLMMQTLPEIVKGSQVCSERAIKRMMPLLQGSDGQHREIARQAVAMFSAEREDCDGDAIVASAAIVQLLQRRQWALDAATAARAAAAPDAGSDSESDGSAASSPRSVGDAGSAGRRGSPRRGARNAHLRPPGGPPSKSGGEQGDALGQSGAVGISPSHGPGGSPRRMRRQRSGNSDSESKGSQLSGVQDVAPESESDTDGEDAEAFEQANFWRYEPPEPGNLEIRMVPHLDAEREGSQLVPGQMFEVCEETRSTEGIVYLRLSDGRGWVPGWYPGVGTLCQHKEGVWDPSACNTPENWEFPEKEQIPEVNIADDDIGT